VRSSDGSAGSTVDGGARTKSAATGFVVILLRVLFSGEGISVHAVDNLLALLMSLFPLSKLQQVAWILNKPLSMVVARRSRHTRLASLSTSSLSTADYAS
jgi:hypothetical protein